MCLLSTPLFTRALLPRRRGGDGLRWRQVETGGGRWRQVSGQVCIAECHRQPAVSRCPAASKYDSPTPACRQLAGAACAETPETAYLQRALQLPVTPTHPHPRSPPLQSQSYWLLRHQHPPFPLSSEAFIRRI